MHKDPHTHWECAKYLEHLPDAECEPLQLVSSASSTSTLCHGWGRFVVADEINKGSHDSSGMSERSRCSYFLHKMNIHSHTPRGVDTWAHIQKQTIKKKTTWDTLTFASTHRYSHTQLYEWVKSSSSAARTQCWAHNNKRCSWRKEVLCSHLYISGVIHDLFFLIRETVWGYLYHPREKKDPCLFHCTRKLFISSYCFQQSFCVHPED